MSEVVVITGASAGVGRAVALEFARHGFRVGLLARGSSRLEEAKAEIQAAGGVAAAVPADVADRYLARNGFESQQTDVAVDPAHADNLFSPAPGAWSAHGIFSNRAKSHSIQWWLNRHREFLTVLIPVLVLAAIYLFFALPG